VNAIENDFSMGIIVTGPKITKSGSKAFHITEAQKLNLWKAIQNSVRNLGQNPIFITAKIAADRSSPRLSLAIICTIALNYNENF
jgi:hypothetical protein